MIIQTHDVNIASDQSCVCARCDCRVGHVDRRSLTVACRTSLCAQYYKRVISTDLQFDDS